MAWVQLESGGWVDDSYVTNPALKKPQYTQSFVGAKYIYLPYEGFNRKKWPNTFKCLLLLYSLPDWHTTGKWVNWGYPENVGG